MERTLYSYMMILNLNVFAYCDYNVEGPDSNGVTHLKMAERRVFVVAPETLAVMLRALKLAGNEIHYSNSTSDVNTYTHTKTKRQ